MVKNVFEFDKRNYSFNDKNEKLELVGDITLNLHYWDCNCVENYIHPMSKSHCEKCNAREYDCPNSRENEVREYFELISQSF